MTAYQKPDLLPLLPLAGYPVAALTTEQLKAQLIQDLDQGRTRMLFFVNTNFVNQCAALKADLKRPEVILVNDGIGMDIAAMLIHRRRFPDNLNGTDFVPILLETLVARYHNQAQRPVALPSVFLLGAGPDVARQAAKVLEGMGVVVAGTLDGYGESADNTRVIETMRSTDADIILVATGNPRQETWILENASSLDARLLIGVGALLDFLAGDKPRAPETIRRLHLEWLYRLSLEPRRLARRYTVDIGHFLIRCFREREQGK
ncbi:WecB/TagA/CpsF family glycosyltransferase [Marinobacter zhanjiangensis]|uniref:GumM protein n=1 Tax=Marinobacter zhanjiangensis TaxID=578215 RepID=A0ABQ3AXQ5_9GAMM|nr:WecB/TagA/CpsF family glycosyltransferase [Marinobacter zhanjiangensis]GGY70113.1 GumM protein [Marinobacter zhanjiangensis]